MHRLVATSPKERIENDRLQVAGENNISHYEHARFKQNITLPTYTYDKLRNLE